MIGMKGFGFGGIVALPSYENCSPLDPACVARNQAKSDQYNKDVLVAQDQDHHATCLASGNSEAYCSAADQVYNRIAAGGPTIVAGSGGGGGGTSFNFTTSRGGSTLYPGDTWNITINNSTPNAKVTADGMMKGANFSGTSFGSTDGNGNWTLSGTVGSGDVGYWQENWNVNGLRVGSVSFQVATPTLQAAPVVTTPSQSPVTNPTSQSTNTTNGVPTTTVFGTSIPDVTLPVVGQVSMLTVLGVAAVGLFLVMRRK